MNIWTFIFGNDEQESLLSRILPPYTSGSADTVFGVEVYGDHSDSLWFKWTIQPYRDYVLKNIDNVYYWIKDRTFTRYHIVNTGLQPGWHDTDYVMFHACFALLERFVEKELGYARTNDEYQYRGFRVHCVGGSDEAAIDLYLWFKYDLKALLAEEAADYRAFNKKYPSEELHFNYIDGLMNKKLDELIKMRHSLWT